MNAVSKHIKQDHFPCNTKKKEKKKKKKKKNRSRNTVFSIVYNLHAMFLLHMFIYKFLL